MSCLLGLCMCVSLFVCVFLSTFLVRSGHGLIWAAASRILVLCFSGYPPLPPVAGAFSGLEGSRGVGACHGGRSGWVVLGLAALWQGVEEGWDGWGYGGGMGVVSSLPSSGLFLIDGALLPTAPGCVRAGGSRESTNTGTDRLCPERRKHQGAGSGPPITAHTTSRHGRQY